MRTQWRAAIGAMGGVMHHGLDYSGAKAGLALAGIEATPGLWADVREIERGALAALSEASS